MKALKLSTLVLLLVSVFSCTKDSIETSAASSKTKGPKPKANPTVTFTVNPSPIYLSSTIEVSGTIAFDIPVDQFTYSVDYSKTQDGFKADGVTPNWTSWQSTGKGETVKLNDPSTKQEDKVVATTFPFSFSLPAEQLGLGKIGFRLQVNGQDVNSPFFKEYSFEILPDPVTCSGLTLEGKVMDAVPTEGEQGSYTFTVQYTVNPCDLKFNMLKTQGGLTNGIELLESKGGLDRQPGSSTNKVITWTEGEKGGAELPSGNRVYTVKFKKAYSGSGEIELTGDWSVSASLVDGTDTKVTFAKIYYSK